MRRLMCGAPMTKPTINWTGKWKEIAISVDPTLGYLGARQHRDALASYVLDVLLARKDIDAGTVRSALRKVQG